MEQKKGLNRDVIKYIAMITMTLNHIAVIFFIQGTLVYQIFTAIGYYTGIVMIYFLVEGYNFTHSKKKYIERLLLFAVISQIPFSFAFTENGGRLNMLFTLCICFLLIWGMDMIQSNAAKICIAIIAILSSFICDWPLLAPVFTLLFIWAGGSREKTIVAFVIDIIIFWIFNFLDMNGIISFEKNILYASLGNIGIGFAAICIILFYNGKRMIKGKKFSKWFFYIFYPVHLLVLGVIRIIIY